MIENSETVAARKKAIMAAGIGNFVEWFDFALYAQFTTVIAFHFFPSNNPTTGLLATFAVFALGFFARPVGGVVFGHYGDKVGRKFALSAAVLMMSAATIAIGLTPTYESIGIAAPVLLIVWRVFQGLSAGGEYAGSSSFVIEYAPKGKRALFGSVNPIATALGVIAGAAVGLLMSYILTSDEVRDWGWRIPFIIAGPLGIVGLYLRNKVEESPEFRLMQERGKEIKHAPLIEALKHAKKKILIMFGWAAVNAIGFYLLTGYMITFMTNSIGMMRTQALIAYIIAMTVFSVACFAAGLAIDRFGIQKIAVGSAILMIVLVMPAFDMLSTGDFIYSVVGLSLYGFTVGVIATITPLLMVELFPASIRYTASALSYNLAYALLGGTAPYIATYLVAQTGSNVSPGYYVAAVTLVGLVIVIAGFRSERDPVRAYV